MIATIPPRGHYAEPSVAPARRRPLRVGVGTAEFGNGTTTVHAQIAATALGTAADRIVIRQSDTDVVGYDTGAFGSAGIMVAGKALHARGARAARQDAGERPPRCAATRARLRARTRTASRCGGELIAADRAAAPRRA